MQRKDSVSRKFNRHPSFSFGVKYYTWAIKCFKLKQMTFFHLVEVVGRASETQLQVSEFFFKFGSQRVTVQHSKITFRSFYVSD